MNMNKALQHLYKAVSGEDTTKRNISKLLVDIHTALTGEAPENKNNHAKIIDSMAENWSGGGGGGSVVPFALRPDAEAWKTYTYDQLIVEDEGVTIPTYAETNKSLKASSSLEVLDLDTANYYYYVVAESIGIPIYNTATTSAKRADHTTSVSAWEIFYMPANFVKTREGYLFQASQCVAVPLTTQTKLYYYSDPTTIGGAGGTYGAYASLQAPTLGGMQDAYTLTVKSPILGLRGNSSYFASTSWSQMTDVRYKYKITVYRAKRNNVPTDGWSITQGIMDIESEYQQEFVNA